MSAYVSILVVSILLWSILIGYMIYIGLRIKNLEKKISKWG